MSANSVGQISKLWTQYSTKLSKNVEVAKCGALFMFLIPWPQFCWIQSLKRNGEGRNWYPWGGRRGINFSKPHRIQHGGYQNACNAAGLTNISNPYSFFFFTWFSISLMFLAIAVSSCSHFTRRAWKINQVKSVSFRSQKFYLTLQRQNK